MKVLIVEDNLEKSAEIRGLIEDSCAPGGVEVEVEASINGAIHALGRSQFDLIVADLVLPQMRDSLETHDATPQWCEHIENHAGARLSSWVVMTEFPSTAIDARQSFARHGVAVIEYDEAGAWRKVLASRVKERFVNPPLDFVIICALEKERSALQSCPSLVYGDYAMAAGLDCREVFIGDLKGIALVLSRTGLVSAAIGTVKAAEIFRPRAIAMCGICGGVEGESELGDLIVPDLSWNYQSGKIVSGKLRPELVQTPIPPVVKAKLQQMRDAEFSKELRSGLLHSELLGRKIDNPPMVSGSQVVADRNEVEKISGQSRKVGALDMEVAAVFAAAHDFFNGGGIYFAAKTVVDMADEDKSDRYHEYGCVLSARFVAEALKNLLMN